MKARDIARLSIDSLAHRGLRSWLTILGIVIGVAAVVTILAIGSGTQQSISGQLGDLGADVLTISAGSQRAMGMGFGDRPPSVVSESNNLTTMDLQVIRTVSGVKTVNGIISEMADVAYMSQTATATVEGVDALAWRDITDPTLDSGRFLTSSDTNSIVIGYGLANNVFKQTLSLNTQITVGSKTFKVVGILAETGGMNSNDNSVIMPINSARTIMENVLMDQFSSIQVKVSDVDAIEETAALIEEKLMLSRHVTNATKDFTVTSSQSMQETISSVMNTLNLFLAGIAATSLLVGAIGIANTMFMSVMERTKQIGTLKALGATNFEVMKMFIFESAFIGLIGGIIGVFLGLIICGIVSEVGVQLIGRGTTIVAVTPELIAFAISFSVIIGVISGVIPAKNAAHLLPVEALRFE